MRGGKDHYCSGGLEGGLLIGGVFLGDMGIFEMRGLRKMR